jgi:hypothetical protein
VDGGKAGATPGQWSTSGKPPNDALWTVSTSTSSARSEQVGVGGGSLIISASTRRRAGSPRSKLSIRIGDATSIVVARGNTGKLDGVRRG